MIIGTTQAHTLYLHNSVASIQIFNIWVWSSD